MDVCVTCLPVNKLSIFIYSIKLIILQFQVLVNIRSYFFLDPWRPCSIFPDAATIINLSLRISVMTCLMSSLNPSTWGTGLAAGLGSSKGCCVVALEQSPHFAEI